MKPGWRSELLENSCMSYRFWCVLLENKKPCYPNGQYRVAAFAARRAKIKECRESSSLLRGWALTVRNSLNHSLSRLRRSPAHHPHPVERLYPLSSMLFHRSLPPPMLASASIRQVPLPQSPVGPLRCADSLLWRPWPYPPRPPSSRPLYGFSGRRPLPAPFPGIAG